MKSNNWFDVGNFLIKKNNTTFGDFGPVLKIEEHYEKYQGHHVINKIFVIEKKNIKVIKERTANRILKFWEKCNEIGSHVEVPDRHPCYREDNVTRKVIIKDQDRQNALYRMIKKTGNLSFQIYKCPSCQEFHMGRNPYFYQNNSKLINELNEK